MSDMSIENFYNPIFYFARAGTKRGAGQSPARRAGAGREFS